MNKRRTVDIEDDSKVLVNCYFYTFYIPYHEYIKYTSTAQINESIQERIQKRIQEEIKRNHDTHTPSLHVSPMTHKITSRRNSMSLISLSRNSLSRSSLSRNSLSRNSLSRNSLSRSRSGRHSSSTSQIRDLHQLKEGYESRPPSRNRPLTPSSAISQNCCHPHRESFGEACENMDPEYKLYLHALAI